MWEIIRANKRKSAILAFCMGLLLMVLGFLIGAVVTGNKAGGLAGVFLAAVIWLILTAVAYYGGGELLMSASKARKIEKKDHPQLYNVVEEITIAAGLPAMPAIYIIDDMSLNAFATGRSPEKSAIAVTAGLLGRLNRDELQGVIAHEMSHITNRDILYMTMLGVMVGSIVLLAEIFLRGVFYSSMSSGRNRYSSSSRKKGGNQGQAILLIIAVVFAIIAPILAQVIYFASSRRREYLADANAAILTRYPEGLASALEAISRDTRPVANVSKVTAPMYIDDPMKKRNFSGLGRTHPPIDKRINILRSLGGTVSFEAYQKLWKKIGGDTGSIPASVLKKREQYQVRSANPESTRKDVRKQVREAADIIRKGSNFAFLSCLCGLNLKLPPEYKGDSIKCPRCKRTLEVPAEQIAVMSGMATAMRSIGSDSSTKEGGSRSPIEVKKNPSGVTVANCSCGQRLNIPQSFRSMKCPNCGRDIIIR